MTTPVLALGELTDSQASKYITVNTALRHIEGRTVRVLSRSTTAPPGSPADGDSYIIPSGATGVWSGKTNQIALWIGGAWSYYVPIEGVTVWVNDLNLLYSFDGANWVATAAAATQPYDVGAFLEPAPTASQIMLRHVVARQVIFASGLAPSQGVAGTAATAQTDFDIQKNGSSVGTMRFAASGTTATFIMASQTTFAAGDRLTVVAPATPDATLAKVSFTLSGTR